MSEEEFIIGRNSVAEVIKSGRSINKILVAKGDRQGSLKHIVGEALKAGVLIQEVDHAKLDSIAPGQRHQGIIAYAAPIQFVDVADIIQIAYSKKEPAFLVLLDELEDPHNVGAILRSADAHPGGRGAASQSVG